MEDGTLRVVQDRAMAAEVILGKGEALTRRLLDLGSFEGPEAERAAEDAEAVAG